MACAHSARLSAEKGVNSLGLTMMVQPAASEGPTFQAAIIRGKLNGQMAATTPVLS